MDRYTLGILQDACLSVKHIVPHGRLTTHSPAGSLTSAITHYTAYQQASCSCESTPLGFYLPAHLAALYTAPGGIGNFLRHSAT